MAGQQEVFSLLRELTSNQNSLYAYIFSLLPNREAAQEVLQETNVAICQKADTFTPGTRFLAWACTIARYQVLAYRRDLGRDRLVFSEGVLEQLAAAGEESFDFSQRLALLEQCLERLTPKQRDLIRNRYRPDVSLDALQAESGYSRSSLGVVLHRLRRSLMRCIERALTAEERG